MGLTSSEVLYMVTPGQTKRCDGCAMWWASKETGRCAVVTGPVKDHQVCGLYVHGKPMEGDEQRTLAHIAPAVAGLGMGDTKCGNCRYGRGARCAHPDLLHFPIDHDGGCCNAWVGRLSLKGKKA